MFAIFKPTKIKINWKFATGNRNERVVYYSSSTQVLMATLVTTPRREAGLYPKESVGRGRGVRSAIICSNVPTGLLGHGDHGLLTAVDT